MRKTPLHHATIVLNTVVIILTIIGITFIYAASSIFALEKYGDAGLYAKKQALGALLGLCGALIISRIPLKIIRILALPAFIFSIMITALPLVIPSLARTIHGSSRWLSLGGFFDVQPGELIKITLVPCCATLLTTLPPRKGPSWLIIAITLSLTMAAAITLLLLPDFGQAALTMATTLILIGVTYPFLQHIALLAVPLIIASTVLIVKQPYRIKRIMTFLNPWCDPQGSGFQIIQSLIAIGSGGLSGVGIAQSQQKFFYLPMQHTDFIFSIIAEETGFIGSCSIIILYIVLLYTGIKIAWNMRSSWSMVTILGITIMISIQALINLAVATGIAPTKGIGLPFISYGISALWAHYAMLGIVTACIRNEQHLTEA